MCSDLQCKPKEELLNIGKQTLTMIQMNKKKFILSTYCMLGAVPGVKATKFSSHPWRTHSVVEKITS